MPTTSFHVIIADDEPGIRGLMARVLARISPAVTISAVSDGQQALQIFAIHGADLLITDWQMAPMDGLALIQAIHAQRTALPILVVTATPVIGAQALLAGATSVLNKPFTVGELVAIVKPFLPP